MALGRGRAKVGEGWSTVPSSLSCQAGNAYNIGLTCSSVAAPTPVTVPVPIHVPVAVPASVHVLVPKSSAGTELKTWLGKVSHAKSINKKKTRTEYISNKTFEHVHSKMQVRIPTTQSKHYKCSCIVCVYQAFELR